MISLHEIAKNIKLERDDEDKDKKVYKTDGGMWAGDYDGDIEYFDDEEKAKHWSQKGDMEFRDDGGDSKDDEDSAGKFGGSDFERDANRAADDEADDMDRDARFDADAEDDNEESDDIEISDANSGPKDRDDIMDMLKNDSEVVDKMGDDVYWDGADLLISKFDDDTIASVDGNMSLGDLKKQIMDYEEDMDETITINGKKYKAIKESKKNPQLFKEIYERTFRSLK